jgi:hypothetical protein
MKWFLWGGLVVGGLLRVLYVWSFEPFLHWDEAPQAYMAQQIAAGRILPLVHFQLPYIGAVEQYPLAVLMLILGDGVATVKLFYLFISLASLWAAHLLYRDLFPPPWNHLALAFFALCPPVLIHFSLQGWSFASLLLFEVIILWLLLSPRARPYCRVRLSLLGLVSGLALYNNVLTLGILGFAAWHIHATASWRQLRTYLLWFTVGYFPMLYFNLINGFLPYKFLAAKFLGITQAMVDTLGPFRALLQGIANKIAGKGPKTDFDIFLSFPRFDTFSGKCLEVMALVVLLLLLAMAFASLLPRFRDRLGIHFLSLSPRGVQILFLVALLLFVVSISTVRYMIVLVPLVPILLCQGLAWCRNISRHLMTMPLMVVFLYLLVGHSMVLAAGNSDPCQPVYAVLEKRHLTEGYGSHEFQSYAAFMSRGRIRVSPQIGPTYIDKIPSFSQAVDQADDVFYILPEGFSLKYLNKNNIQYKSEQVGGWAVIWDLSKRVYPKELLSPEELARADGYMRWSYRENPLVLNAFRGGH